ncbi:MAG TPA: sigma-70 family RNA polymerase sigma factor [Planococcus sp. (in: firmicutes)]|nr:sigma-70 family RNA polymerase sigma factor [Planococcus sp. (in: firmicutes)]
MEFKSDRELMELVYQKHRAALEELYERYIRLVYSFVFKFCNGNSDKTKEISQLIFLKLWTTDSIYDESKGSFVNWLLTVSRNVCIDYFRQEQAHNRSKRAFGDVQLLEQENHSNEIERLIDHNEITEAKKCLTAAQLRTINLFYWKGYTLPEISRIEDEPVGTIKSRLHQSLIKLRKQIGEED